ncbi:MAG: hypothetical protein COB30_015315 [Ectothiorhodospiraceae bacterium]|nr:hypothetical protein [Ectothiorhodospiraceae bacterium]
MRSYSLTLLANASQKIDVPGDFFRIKSASASSAVLVQVGTGPFTSLDEGEAIKFERNEFSQLTIKSAVAQTVVLIIGYGVMFDDSPVVSVVGTVSMEPANTLDNGGDVSLLAAAETAIRAADASVLSVVVKADIANTVAVRIGTTGVAAATGYPLEPGETLVISTTAAISGYNADAAAQNIHVLPLRTI